MFQLDACLPWNYDEDPAKSHGALLQFHFFWEPHYSSVTWLYIYIVCHADPVNTVDGKNAAPVLRWFFPLKHIPNFAGFLPSTVHIVHHFWDSGRPRLTLILLVAEARMCCWIVEQPVGSVDTLPFHPRLDWLINHVAYVSSLTWDTCYFKIYTHTVLSRIGFLYL